MPKKTMDLFGYPRSRYEPELTVLATKRIEDGKNLLKVFVKKRDNMITMTPFEKEDLVRKYSETEAAVEWWKKILEEE